MTVDSWRMQYIRAMSCNSRVDVMAKVGLSMVSEVVRGCNFLLLAAYLCQPGTSERRTG